MDDTHKFSLATDLFAEPEFWAAVGQIILWGSKLVPQLMDRFPVIITLGAALLGYIAGEMLAGDRVVQSWVETEAPWLVYAAPIACASLVVVLGKGLAARKTIEAPLEDLTRGGAEPSSRGESERESK
jgi:hypothetical protein